METDLKDGVRRLVKLRDDVLEMKRREEEEERFGSQRWASFDVHCRGHVPSSSPGTELPPGSDDGRCGKAALNREGAELWLLNTPSLAPPALELDVVA